MRDPNVGLELTTEVGTIAVTVAEAPAAAEELVSGRLPTRVTFHELAEDHVDFVYRSLCRAGLDSATADDATQQVFLVAANKLDSIERGKERGFLYLTAKNVAAQLRQRTFRRAEVALEEDDPLEPAHGDTPSLDELLDQRRARQLLDDVLAAMPEKLEEIFVLCELEELTMPEVAACLELRVGTAKSRLRRAREVFDMTLKRLQTRAAFPGSTP